MRMTHDYIFIVSNLMKIDIFYFNDDIYKLKLYKEK